MQGAGCEAHDFLQRLERGGLAGRVGVVVDAHGLDALGLSVISKVSMARSKP